MTMELVHQTELGQLFKGDCLEVLQSLRAGSVHTFFADPPFNLNKKYGRSGSNDLPEEKYLEWSKAWLKEATRVLAPGGSLFVYNLPKIRLTADRYQTDYRRATMACCTTSKARRPASSIRDAVRIPIQACRHCGKDVTYQTTERL
jgi:site-specific DNA-methyltransferase (adenine-specific)